MRRYKAFTLIELLIVVAIIGILAAIAVPNFMNARVRAQVGRVLADLRSIHTAIEMYSTDQGREIRDTFEIPNYNGTALHVWSQLTTPVSYISSGAFYDPFVPEYSLVSPTAGNEAVRVGTYQYHNIKLWREGNRGGMAALADKTARYYVRSAGPDRWYIQHPMRLMTWMAYEPTNGLRSVGDIILSDKGILGKTFRGNPGPFDYL